MLIAIFFIKNDQAAIFKEIKAKKVEHKPIQTLSNKEHIYVTKASASFYPLQYNAAAPASYIVREVVIE